MDKSLWCSDHTKKPIFFYEFEKNLYSFKPITFEDYWPFFVKIQKKMRELLISKALAPKKWPLGGELFWKLFKQSKSPFEVHFAGKRNWSNSRFKGHFKKK